jgi:hypothetical protein
MSKNMIHYPKNPSELIKLIVCNKSFNLSVIYNIINITFISEKTK